MVFTNNDLYFFVIGRPKSLNPMVGTSEKILECEDPNISQCYIMCTLPILSLGKGEGKAISLQPWTGPEGFRRLRFPDFKTIGT
jgi:hypothetical protein